MARETDGFGAGYSSRRGGAPATALADTIVGDLSADTILGVPSPSGGVTLPDEGIASLAGDRPTVAADLQLLSALICQELRVENGAATAVRVADTFQVPSLPLSQPVAMMLRFRGAPGAYDLSLQMEGDAHRLYAARIEIAPGGSPCRTVLVPNLNLTLSRLGEQRILIQARSRVIGSLPIYVKRQGH